MYQYTALLDNKTETATATTMDSTNHNIIWTTYSIGDISGGSSSIYDVAIINDTLAYAVGDFYNSGTEYNIAKWNGSNWSYERVLLSYKILWPNSIGDTIGFYQIRSIIAFNENDIWIAAGTVQHWNGIRWEQFQGAGAGSANKIWGYSSTDLYFVGYGGLIVHYDGTSWTSINSGTSLDFSDIWGGVNESTNQTEILAVASQYDINNGNAIVSLNGTTATNINGNGLNWGIGGVWFVPGRQYYIVGHGIGQKHNLQSPTWSVYPAGTVTSYSSGGIRGRNINDVFVAGSFGDLLHFNGVTWCNYHNQVFFQNGALGCISIKGNIVLIGGYNGSQAVAIIGSR